MNSEDTIDEKRIILETIRSEKMYLHESINITKSNIWILFGIVSSVLLIETILGGTGVSYPIYPNSSDHELLVSIAKSLQPQAIFYSDTIRQVPYYIGMLGLGLSYLVGIIGLMYMRTNIDCINPYAILDNSHCNSFRIKRDVIDTIILDELRSLNVLKLIDEKSFFYNIASLVTAGISILILLMSSKWFTGSDYYLKIIILYIACVFVIIAIVGTSVRISKKLKKLRNSDTFW